MKRFFPLLCLILAVVCGLAVLPRMLDVYVLLEAILPMVTSSPAFASAFAIMYVMVLAGLSFLAGVFLTMAFTVKLADKEKSND